MTFASLGLIEPLQRALDELDYKTPTPVQAQAIPAVLAGRDLMAAAQTGTAALLACAVTATGIRSPMNSLLGSGAKPLLVIIAATLVALGLSALVATVLIVR